MEMKKITMLFLPLVFLAGLCMDADAVTLKIATAAPEGSTWMKEMRAGAKEISSRSEGRVRIKYFAGGVMGNDKSVMRKIRIGQLQGGAFIAGSLEDIAPSINLFSLPMIFRSYDEVDYVRSRMDKDLKNEMEKAGFACFGFAEGGFARIMSPQPIRSTDDARGLKIWVPEGDRTSYRAMESLGLAPVTLPITDVMTGLQAKLIEVVASSPIGALAFQWHTRIKYVTELPLSYLYATLVIDQRYFKKVAPADQEIVREVMERIYSELNVANRQENQKAIAAMTQQGIEFIDASEEASAQWRQVAANLNQQMGKEGAFSPALYQQILDHLNDFRSGKVTRIGN
jgi:TRAP-type C4-dicarboxylate transport system substrate-binding protein